MLPLTRYFASDVYSRIQSESATGSVESQRVRLTLSISIDNVDFDTQVGMLRISGRVIVENPHVKVCLNGDAVVDGD